MIIVSASGFTAVVPLNTAVVGQGNQIQLGAGIAQSALTFTRDEVARTLGPASIAAGDEILTRYGEHTLPSPDQRPAAVAFPDSTSAVQALVRSATPTPVSQ